MIPLIESLEAAIAFYAQNPTGECICRVATMERRCNSLAEAKELLEGVANFAGNYLPLHVKPGKLENQIEVVLPIEGLRKLCGSTVACESEVEQLTAQLTRNLQQYVGRDMTPELDEEIKQCVIQSLATRIHDSFEATLPREAITSFKKMFNEAIASDTSIPFVPLPPEVYSHTDAARAAAEHPNGPGVANVQVALVPFIKPELMWRDPNRQIW